MLRYLSAEYRIGKKTQKYAETGTYPAICSRFCLFYSFELFFPNLSVHGEGILVVVAQVRVDSSVVRFLDQRVS